MTNFMQTKIDKIEEKYLEDKIALILASVSGAQIGANMLGRDGRVWEYNFGIRTRKLIEKDIRDIYKYAFNKGKKYDSNR